MKRLILHISLFYSCCIAAQEAQPVLTLKNAIETGIKNNLTVQQTGLQVQTDEVNWKQSRLNQLPALNGTVGNGINQGRSIDPFTNSYSNRQISYSNYGINSGVVLFSGLSLRNTTAAGALTYQASKYDLQQAKDELAINIMLAFIQVLNNEDALQLLRNQALLTRSQVERLMILNQEGAIAPATLADMEGQYANDQLAIVNMENALENSKLTLSQLMFIPYTKALHLERLKDSIVTPVIINDRSIQDASKSFALVRAAELRRQSAQRILRATKGNLWPVLSLNASANTNYSSAAFNDILVNTTEVVTNNYVIVNGNNVPVIQPQKNFTSERIAYRSQLSNNLFTSLSLNLRIPIFNSLWVRNRIKLATLNLKSAGLTVEAARTGLQQFIEQASLNRNSALARQKLLIEQVKAFTESFRSAEIRFNSGLGNSIDYLTAKNNLDRAALNLISAGYDLVLREKILHYYLGQMAW